jgi:tetraacyldisaccharide 4'-kinase
MSARRSWAWPLVPLYATALAGKFALRRVGLLRTQRLSWPVVSVGSLSAGGAGKTPVVIALAKLLSERGWTVDVLSRGYGRSGTGVERVDANAEEAALRFGDEPAMIAQSTGVPVWVGAERFTAGKRAEAAASQAGSRRVHLLDDGFQHRQLARAMDVVLVTAKDLDDALLPVGNRRERWRALRQADVVVVTEQERDRVEEHVRQFMRKGASLWTVRRELRFPDALALCAGPGPIAFCAIARPESFWQMLKQSDCNVVGKVAYSDHHAYKAADMERLVKVARERGATGFLTTEKDRVKLSDAMLERLQTVGPLGVVGLDAKFLDEAEVIRELEARCR